MDAIEHTPQHTYLVVRQHPTTVFDNHLQIVFTKGILCTVFRCFDRDLFTFLGIHGGNASETIVWISLLWLFGLVGHIREDFKLSTLTMSTANCRNRTQHHPASITLFFLRSMTSMQDRFLIQQSNKANCWYVVMDPPCPQEDRSDSSFRRVAEDDWLKAEALPQEHIRIHSGVKLTAYLQHCVGCTTPYNKSRTLPTPQSFTIWTIRVSYEE